MIGMAGGLTWILLLAGLLLGLGFFKVVKEKERVLAILAGLGISGLVTYLSSALTAAEAFFSYLSLFMWGLMGGAGIMLLIKILKTK